MKPVVFKSASQETAFLHQHRGRQTDDVLREQSVKELEVNVVPGFLHFLGLCQLTTLQPDMHVASFKTTTNDGRDRPSSGGICHHCPHIEVRYDRNWFLTAVCNRRQCVAFTYTCELCNR